jgi:hypothetical protein
MEGAWHKRLYNFLSCVSISQPVILALSLTSDHNGNGNRLSRIRPHSDPADSAHPVDHARGPASRDRSNA